MSVCTFKRLPFICFFFYSLLRRRRLLLFKLFQRQYIIAATPPAQAGWAGKQAVKDSNLRFYFGFSFWFRFSFFIQGFHLLLVLAVAAVRLMLVWIRPYKTKMRQDSAYSDDCTEIK